ncbi:MAG: nucleotidyltransferase domain-containing protein, partial [Rhodanobacteraceae bacterium]
MNPRLVRTLTPERRFLLACARIDADRDAVARLAGDVRSWDRVLQESHRHHLLPLLSRASAGCEAVPSFVRDRAHEAQQRTQAVNSIYLRDAREALLAFAQAGLSPVVLKGVSLAESLYPDIGLRAFCDLDALFAIEDLERAEAVLRELGYEQEPSPHERDWYFEHYYQLPRFARRAGGFCVELHWDLGRRPYPFHLDLADMQSRAVQGIAAGVPARVLDNEDLLLHLAVHLAWGNGFDGHVRGIVDIAEVIRRGVDWNRFEARVIEAGAAQVVVPSLELAAWLLDAPVPPNVLLVLGERRGGVLSRLATDVGQG